MCSYIFVVFVNKNCFNLQNVQVPMLSLVLALSHPLTLTIYTHTLYFSESLEDVTSWP